MRPLIESLFLVVPFAIYCFEFALRIPLLRGGRAGLMRAGNLRDGVSVYNLTAHSIGAAIVYPLTAKNASITIRELTYWATSKE